MSERQLVAPRDLIGPLWLGDAAARVIMLGYAGVRLGTQYTGYLRPWLGLTVLAVMAVWTVVVVASCVRPKWRLPWLVAVDLAVTCGLMLTSRGISMPDKVATDTLITTLWAGIVPVSAGLVGGWRFGAAAGAVLTVCTGLTHFTIDHHLATNGVLMITIGVAVGAVATTATRSSEALARALRTEAANAERERLASSIHDSVLQVLARVRRRGAELGGEAAELATLAGEQEIALRALVASGPVEQTEQGEVDLRALLTPLATSRVEVATPATPALVSSTVADDLAAAVREALANVTRHAGDGAHAWVLLEDLGSEVIVSVRDDGVGIAEGRLAAAASEGRLGVTNSITAKVAHLGGAATCESASGQGTEWELRVPRVALAGTRRRR